MRTHLGLCVVIGIYAHSSQFMRGDRDICTHISIYA